MSKFLVLAGLVALGSSVAIAAVSAGPAPSFAARKSYTTGVGAVSIAIGDLNRDSKPDLATVRNDYAGSLVSIHLNRGDGTLRAERNYPTGYGPVSIAIGDLSGDGMSDLATANVLANTVSVLSNRGDGAFEHERDYPTGRRPETVAIGDLNGDGRPDLATANSDGNTVSVLLNNGDGSFLARLDYATGRRPWSVSIGDLNADSQPDLAVANVLANTVSVLLNKGDGSFKAKVDYRTGRSPGPVAIGDLNGDARSDLVIANFLAHTVSVLLNSGAGTFGARRDYPIGYDPVSIAIGDLNGDRKPDLATANLGPSSISVLANGGGGRFQAKLDYRTGTFPRSIAIGDLNADGKQDLATADFDYEEGESTVSVLLNTPGLCTVQNVKGQRLPAAKRTIARANCRVGKIRRAYSKRVKKGRVISQKPKFGAVLPGGGKVNLAVSRGEEAVMRASLVAFVAVVVLCSSAGAGELGSSGPSFGRARAYATGHPAAAVAVSDLTGDAKPDLVSANGSRTHTVSVLINKGNGSFRAKREFGTGRGPGSVAIGDLNADGSRDIATANHDANTVSVLFNNGDGSLRPRRDYATGPGTRLVAIDDVNGDGKPDLVTANDGNAKGISVLLNTGDGTFEANRDFGPRLLPVDLAIGDLNGDSKADLAIVNENLDNGNLGLSVFLNAGDGTFPAMREYGTYFGSSSVAIGDLNGDRKADLAVASSDKEAGPGVLVYLNRGQGGFRSGVRYSVHGDWATGGSSVAIGDLNGDRKADLAVTSRIHAVSVLVNLGDGRFQNQLDYGTGYPRALAIDDLTGDGRRDLVVTTSPTVSVLLNKPGLCNVQELRRQTLKATKRTLARVNCRIGKVSFDYSRTIKGLVIRQKPKLGAVLPRGSRVDVVISRGGRS